MDAGGHRICPPRLHSGYQRADFGDQRDGLYRQRRPAQGIGHIFVYANGMSDFGFIGGERRQKLSDRTKASVILKRQVSREKADELRSLQASADEAVAAQLERLLFDEDVRRAYPRGAFLTQTLGLTNVDSVGQSGLELQYESLLRGTAGVSLRSVDGKSQPIYDSGNLYIEPQDGNSIKLTIDATIQEICEKAMRECYDVNKAQAVHLIAMDPYTGAILAMCSKPDYDPNDPPRDQA